MVSACALALVAVLAALAVAPAPAAVHQPAKRQTLQVHAAQGDAAQRDAISDLADRIRQIILEGDEELGIPVLDPFRLEGYENVRFEKENAYEVSATLLDVEATGLAGFLHGMTAGFSSLIPARVRVTVPLSVPLLHAAGDYSFDSLLGDVVHLYGKGKFRLDVTNINVTTVVIVQANLFSGTEVYSIDVDLNIQDFQFTVDGLMDGGIVGPLFGSVVNLLAKVIYDGQKATLEEYLENALHDPIQAAVGEIGWSDILCILLNRC